MKLYVLLQITKEDALPKHVCQKCVNKLDMFFEFRISCMATDTVLKNYVDSLKHLATAVSNHVKLLSPISTYVSSIK